MTDGIAVFGDERLPSRFWAKVERRPSGCWTWTANTVNGYGRIRVGQRLRVAHEWLYEELVGAVPAEFELDHVCHTRTPTCLGGPGCLHRGCVRPDHLEAVTAYENMLRGRSVQARNALKTHCDRGHEFTPENTRWETTGSRRCRTCKRAEGVRYQAKKRALTAAAAGTLVAAASTRL